jgi:putative SOS response-associated peptidase YedK
MCGRYTLSYKPGELEEAFSLPPGFREERRYNIAPGQWVIVIRPDRDGGRVGGLARWGLVPAWAKDPEGGPRPINARSEGVEAKPAFRGALRRGRCLIPATGFFEWQAGSPKQAFYIQPREGTFLAFAGLSDHWEGEAGPLDTCAILTTAPNALMAPIHDRMPVILPEAAWAAWLDPGTPLGEVLGQLLPCPAEALRAHPVGPEVGQVRNDHPGLIEPLAGLGILNPDGSAPIGEG